MRMFIAVQLPTQSGNESIKSGTMPKVMARFIERFKPEGAYFITHEGDRCVHFYFDLADVTLMPSAVEPFFLELGAKVTWCPAMDWNDVQKGIATFMAGN